jgi:hypothetical protein
MTSPSPDRFADLASPRRLWVVGSVSGASDRLAALHDHLGPLISPGDRLIYLGNYMGTTPDGRDAVDEILAFRRALLAKPGMIVSDIIYLRGVEEQIWQKLLQLHLAPNPSEVLNWMLRQGIGATLAAYGTSADDGLLAVKFGTMAVAKWTNALRKSMRAFPGHDNLMTALRRAAYTSTAPETPGPLLFVPTGVDPSRPLAAQGDSFWWGGPCFNGLSAAYGSFEKVVRGHDPAHQGFAETPFSLTLDGGGDKPISAACLAPTGQVKELICS